MDGRVLAGRQFVVVAVCYELRHGPSHEGNRRNRYFACSSEGFESP